MICKFCSVEIPDSSTICPCCGNDVSKKKEPFLKSPSKGGKSFAAIFTALTLIPAIFITTIDYVWDYQVNWKGTGYIVGALLVMWICSVLPVIRITPAPVTATICFGSVAMYVLFVIRQITGSMEWFSNFALPLVAVLALFIGINSALYSSGKVKGWLMAALVSFETSLYSIIWGIVWDNYYHHGIIRLRFSVICAAIFLALAILLFTLAYIVRVNKKK